MLECNIESHPFWCSNLGQVFIVAIIILVVIAIGNAILKKWNQPRDISNYPQPTPANIAQNVYVKVQNEASGTAEALPEEIVEEDLQEDVEETDEFDYSSEEEDFYINLDEEIEIFLSITGLNDITYDWLIKEFFRLDQSEFPATIVDYDQNNNLVVFALTLNTTQIVNFRIPMDNIKFYANNLLPKPSIEVEFANDFLETEFQIGEEQNLMENIHNIDWDDEIFGVDNYDTIKITISEEDYISIFNK